MLALVTTATTRGSDPDLPLLTAALTSIGVESRVVDWDDPAVAWTDFSAAIVRSTWDYTRRLTDFTAWCAAVARRTMLWNPPDVIAWNTDKRYLTDLDAAGVPVVATTFVSSGGELDSSWLGGRVVVKPSIGADSEGAARFDDDVPGAVAHVEGLIDFGLTAMVQPYQAGIDDAGEIGLVYLDGEFSHAFRKPALLDGTPLDRDEAGIMTHADHPVVGVEATPLQLTVGDQAVGCATSRFGRLAYARVDLVPAGQGFAVLELELVEPSLFLDTDPTSPARAARAFAGLSD